MLIAPQQTINLITTNIPDNTEPVWDSSTTYNVDDRVQYGNYVYKALEQNTGVQPDTDLLTWFNEKPINKWAAFDGWTDTKTEYNDDIYYEFSVSDVDVITFFNLYGTKVLVELVNNLDNNTIFTKEYELGTYDISDWWEWTYTPPTYKRDFAIFLPMVYDGTLKVTIYNREGVSKVSNIVYGRTQALGATLYGAKVSRRTTIKKERGADGRLYTSVGNKYKRISVPVMIDTENVDLVLQRLDEINGIPTLFIGDEREGGFESLLVYGLFKDLDIPISLVKSQYEIEIEGVG